MPDISTTSAMISALLPYLTSSDVINPLLFDSAQKLYNSLKERIREKSVQEATVKEFEARLKNIETEDEKYNDLINESKDPTVLIDRTIREMKGVTRQVITLDSQDSENRELIRNTFDFYKKSMYKLLSATPKKDISSSQLAGIRTELGVIRLQVEWQQAKMVAYQKQQNIERDIAEQKAKSIENNEKRLHRRMFIVLFIYVILISLILVLGVRFFTPNTPIPILGIPLSVILWSVLGSIANMLYRFYHQKRVEDVDSEIRWYSARPLVGIIMGFVIYLLLKAGVVFIGLATSQDPNAELRIELLWLFAFLGGFSDRFFEAAIEKVGLLVPQKDGKTEEISMILELINSEKLKSNSTQVNKNVEPVTEKSNQLSSPITGNTEVTS